MNQLVMGDFSGISWMDKMAFITFRLSTMPQIDMPLTHTFEEGKYIREIRIPAGTFLIGSTHLHGHYCELVSGSVMHVTEHSKSVIHAPYSIQTSPGYQMVVYALTDVVSRTIHPNIENTTDIKALEDRLFEPKESVLERGHYVNERVLYKCMLRQYGIDEEMIRPLFESEKDLIPFPSRSQADIGISKIHGRGLIAAENVDKDSEISIARVAGMRTPAGRYTNHSFDPNSRMVRDENGDLYIRSIKNILPGEEVTIDYREAIKLSTEVACLQQLSE